MDYTKSLRAFVSSFPVGQLNGQEKLLAVAAHCAGGSTDTEVPLRSIQANWPKTTLQIQYHPNYVTRADEEGFIKPVKDKKGVYTVTPEGFERLLSLLGGTSSVAAAISAAGLHVFDVKQTHNFDKFLRKAFASATKEVCIADPYVDETIFDNLLDQIPSTSAIRLIHNKKQGTYDARATRFAMQYSKFQTKSYTELHDRFLLIDGKGYIVGPSLKDAARKSPALVVSLSDADSATLQMFFDELWRRAV